MQKLENDTLTLMTCITDKKNKRLCIKAEV
jgi:sortase (surface protein transpeptidase)